MSDTADGRMRIEEVPLHMVLGSAPAPKIQKKAVPSKKEGSPVSKARERLGNVLGVLEKLELEDSKMTVDQKMAVLVDMEFAMDSLRRLLPDVIRKDEEPAFTALSDTWNEIGYYVKKDEYGLKMVLPPVMMERSKKKATEKEKTAEREYAMNSVKRFLLMEKSRNGITDSFLKDQVLIFTHERIKEGFFDIDNLSTSYYINAISDVFLAGDTAKNLDLMQRFIRGEENRTICYLVERSKYSKWVKDRYESK